MLVVTSNWAFGDGTLVSGPDPGVVRTFLSAVARRALRAGVRRDGTYRPIESVDVVVAGDTGDWLVSRRWTGRHRPWHGGRAVAGLADGVAMESMRAARRLLAGLATLARRGLWVSQADRRGRPIVGSRHPVTVRVALLAGDRDRWMGRYCHSGTLARWSFAHGTDWSNGIVRVRHGDDLDPLCSPLAPGVDVADPARMADVGGHRSPTVGESIAVDLLARFGEVVATRAVGPFPVSLLSRLASLRAVDMADHLADAIARPEYGAGVRRSIVTAWRRAVGDWHRAARRTIADGDLGVDWIDPLAAWLDGVEQAGTGRRANGLAADTLEPLRCLPPGGDDGVEAVALTVLGHAPGRPSPVRAGRHVCLGPAACGPVHDPPLQRSHGLDLAWIDAARIPVGPRTHEASATTVAVFDDRPDRTRLDGLHPHIDRSGCGDGPSVRVEALTFRGPRAAEWTDIDVEIPGRFSSLADRHARIVDAA